MLKLSYASSGSVREGNIVFEVSDMSEQQSTSAPKYISIDAAGDELGVSRTTMYYYIKQLNIEIKKFPLDRKAYIKIEDLEGIKAAKKAAEEDRR
jgi:hypothetical protein